MLYDKASGLRNWAVGGATAHSTIIDDPRATLVRLQPTDCLYIPLRWWHVIFGVEGEVSIAVAHFWVAAPAMRQRINEPNPLPMCLEAEYFVPAQTSDSDGGDAAEMEEVGQVENAAVGDLPPDADDEESEIRHEERLGSERDAAMIVPPTQCRRLRVSSNGVTTTPLDVGVDNDRCRDMNPSLQDIAALGKKHLEANDKSETVTSLLQPTCDGTYPLGRLNERSLSIAFEAALGHAYQHWLAAQPPLPSYWLSQPLLLLRSMSKAAMWDCIRAAEDGVSPCKPLLDGAAALCPALDADDDEGSCAGTTADSEAEDSDVEAARSAGECFSHAVLIAGVMLLRAEHTDKGSAAADKIALEAVRAFGSSGWLNHTLELRPNVDVGFAALLMQLVLDRGRPSTLWRSRLAFFRWVLCNDQRRPKESSHELWILSAAACDVPFASVSEAISNEQRVGHHQTAAFLMATAARHLDVLAGEYHHGKWTPEKLQEMLNRLDGMAEFRRMTPGHSWHSHVYRMIVTAFAQLNYEMGANEIARAAMRAAAQRGALTHPDLGCLGGVGDCILKPLAHPTPWVEPGHHPGIARIHTLLEGAWLTIRDEFRAAVSLLQRESHYNQWCVPAEANLQSEPGFFLSCDVVFSGAVDVGRPLARLLNTTIRVLRDIKRHVAPVGQATFNILRPGASIPPHFGSTELRLRHMLSLSAPPCTAPASTACAHLRVGWEMPPRPFVEGKVQSFDDNFIHQVHYPAGLSDQQRVAFVVDTVNPMLARDGPPHSRRGPWDEMEAFREAWWRH